jgi:hypothetical protein
MNPHEPLESFRSGEVLAPSEQAYASPEGLELQGGYPMSSAPVAPAAAQSTASKSTRHRILPAREDRSFIPISLNRAMDLNLELYCLLTRQPKNRLVEDVLSHFLSKNTSSFDDVHEQTFPPDQKSRVTFVISKDLQKRLDAFVNRTGCNQSRTVVSALLKFLKMRGIEPYTDPADRVLRQLQRPRGRRDRTTPTKTLNARVANAIR